MGFLRSCRHISFDYTPEKEQWTSRWDQSPLPIRGENPIFLILSNVPASFSHYFPCCSLQLFPAKRKHLACCFWWRLPASESRGIFIGGTQILPAIQMLLSSWLMLQRFVRRLWATKTEPMEMYFSWVSVFSWHIFNKQSLPAQMSLNLLCRQN